MWINPGNRAVRTGLHVLVWSLLICLPYLLFPRTDNAFNPGLMHLIPLVCYALVFYSNYLFLTDKFLFERKFMHYFLINAAMLLALLWANWWMHEWWKPVPGNMVKGPRMFPGKGPAFNKFFVLKDLFSLFVPVIFAIAIRATERWIRTEAEKKEVVNKNLESELEHLRYQLQPHFFFNSLNNIYSLIAISPEQAQDTVLGLSKLMRYLLYETDHKEVNLADEITFMTNYIKLMEIRQSGKTTTVYEFPQLAEKQLRIAPLLFIPMIENAYKHGVSATKPSWIYFHMELNDHSLVFLSGNSGFPKNASDVSGSGIGLDNLRKRLELCYPGRHRFEMFQGKAAAMLHNRIPVQHPEGEPFWIRLELKLHAL